MKYLEMINGNHLLIKVEDSGKGIEKKHLWDIFKRGFTVELDDNGKKINRSKMGLYLVKKFISSMGGDISVSSRIGKGTTFSFTIKLHIPGSSEGSLDETSGHDK